MNIKSKIFWNYAWLVKKTENKIGKHVYESEFYFAKMEYILEFSQKEMNGVVDFHLDGRQTIPNVLHSKNKKIWRPLHHPCMATTPPINRTELLNAKPTPPPIAQTSKQYPPSEFKKIKGN